MSDPALVFDRRLLRQRRSKACAGMAKAGFLHEEVAARLLERLGDINRPFDSAVALGWDAPHQPLPARHSFYADLSPGRAARMPGPALACDEEWLPLRDDSLSLVISNLALHWVNDLPGTLIQINRALRPDGLFLAAMLGGETLMDLRRALMDAELDLCGGVRPRVSPMADLRDMGGLLQRAGFAMPVVDSDLIEISYGDPLALLHDLRAMGESNVLYDRQKSLWRRDVLMEAMRLYQSRHSNMDGRITARFQILFLTGWAPGPGQPRPKQPGSATRRLADALGSREISIKNSRDP
ncbi:SAM-dependent methyltransferase [Iodidimonas nitroreducens]|uniref:SAM-dependent methyltransferase n=1 Tax=Iodidimonas nitroreducens TaxID=1236968 RepID=A0A5A7NE01_9PROT|nr:methyltransferase domain-containing protein [Iodidimonas nitroreducens]GAK34169.1 NADH dehydrogenase [ubiquinone] 1 alpha subcomplex assembly factor 5 [alpha proteobacterium Q-1]GER05289.1 SAM-dependent methyltransferase [Iodidimonas nitroreducens]